MPIKYIDFEKTKHIDPSFKDAYGLYDEKTDTVYIHSGLKDISQPSKQEILLHEKAHRRIYKAGVNKYFTQDQEEAFCDLWAIMLYKQSRIHGLEKLVRQRIEAGGRLRNQNDRSKIIKNMLEFIGVKPSYSLINALL